MWRELAQWLKGLPTSVAWVRFQPGTISGLSLFLVLAWLPGFSSKLSSFPSNTKTNAPNSSSARIEEPHENQLRLINVASSLNIVHTDNNNNDNNNNGNLQWH